MKIMDPSSIAFIVIFAVFLVVIAGLVTYLLIRRQADEKDPKLQPEDKVSTTYGEPNVENGLITKDGKVPSTSSSSDLSKKPLDSDSVVIDIASGPEYETIPRTKITLNEESAPVVEEPIVPTMRAEKKLSGEKSPRFSEENEKKTFKFQKDSDKACGSSSSSLSDDEIIVIDDAEKTSLKSSSSSSDDEERHPVDEIPVYASVNKNKKYGDDYERLIPQEKIIVPTDADLDASGHPLTSSSSSDETHSETIIKKRKKSVKLSKTKDEATSSSSSEDESGSETTTKRKKKKEVYVSGTSSSGDEKIINHKKTKHRKKFIHNIEEVEIIEEHTYNKKRKKVYRRAPGSGELVSVTASEEENEESTGKPKVIVKRSKKMTKTTQKGSSESRSSSSDDDTKSPEKETTYHTEYRYDVPKKEDEIIIETEIPPSERKSRRHIYTELIRSNKTRDVSMRVDKSSSSSSTSDEESDARIRTEKNISISSTPKFKPFSATVKVEKKNSKPSFSSSSNDTKFESEADRRVRSETQIKLARSPTEQIDEPMILAAQSEPAQTKPSSSSESEDEIPMKSSSTSIKLKSPSSKYASFEWQRRGSSSSSSSSDEKEVILSGNQDQSSSSSSENEGGVRSSKKKRRKTARLIQREEKVVEEYIPSTLETTQETIVTTETKKVKKPRKEIKFTSGWKKQVTVEDLFKAGVLSEKTIIELEQGNIEQAEVEKSLHIYLVGEEPIAGLLMSDTGEKVSIYDAWRNGLIRRGTSISLLEAQAATGRIIDPKTADKMSVSEATQKRFIDRQFEAVLMRAERAVYGYKTRISNETLSLFAAMKRGLVVENHGIRLLEAQIATGGIIDPKANHRLPVEVAFERGLFDKRMNDILEDPSDDTRGFFDPNTEENLTYMELMQRCVIDKDTGLRLLPFRSGKTKISTKASKVVFESANKKQVLLQDVLDAGLVDSKTARKFDQGKMTPEEVKSMVANLKVFVDGTMPIAGVINSLTGEKMSMVEAYKSGLLRKGTTFELLEAQAACGKIIDVQTAKAVSLETARRIGVIDSEFFDCVSRADRAVSGYREPFKREVLSLCEAMARHLVVQRHAIRLLEAQIATGGIIEVKSPVRISVEVALKRGLLDYDLAQKLGKRVTASYFDPVTGENLNYSELMGRCVLDKDSSLLYLMVEGGTVTQNIRPFEREPQKKLREKAQGKITTEVVEATQKRGTLKRSKSPPPESVPSTPPAILSRRVVIVDPNTGNELTVQEALQNKLIDEATAKQLLAQEGDFQE